jgi:hypothetical protein
MLAQRRKFIMRLALRRAAGKWPEVTTETLFAYCQQKKKNRRFFENGLGSRRGYQWRPYFWIASPIRLSKVANHSNMLLMLGTLGQVRAMCEKLRYKKSRSARGTEALRRSFAKTHQLLGHSESGTGREGRSDSSVEREGAASEED